MLITRNGKEEYSDNFNLWCRKTEHLEDEDWARAFESVELEIIAKKGEGKEAWPPSYAEFLFFAKASSTPNKGANATAYLCFNDPKHPQYEVYQQIKGQRLGIESDEHKEKRQRAGRRALDELNGMF